MITFTCCLIGLIAGYFIYGRIVEKMLGVSSESVTPAYRMQDGVDYIPMPTWKIFTIQFLNIAGLGPIFGAILGAKFGTASFLWITLGCVLAGAVHDYIAGFLSLRRNGDSLPQIISHYLGKRCKDVLCCFIVVLMLLVGVVFVSGPAALLAKMTPAILDEKFWIISIFIYYIFATLLPINKVIGKIYPIFGAALLFMAVGILVMMYVTHPALPELTDGLANKHPDGLPIFPIMFVSISCGAISGFHATQSPMMARCLKNEKYTRPVFYGAMITEGIVALIWAAAATYFFQKNGMGETNAAVVVDAITEEWLGSFGAILAALGVIAAPITTGDTAFRSARLIIADYLHFEQTNIKRRLVISVPMFVIAMAVLIYSLTMKDSFNMFWRYTVWTNQVLSSFTLWALTIYLYQQRKAYIMTLIPALFMTMVCATYIFVAPEGLAWSNYELSLAIATVFTILVFVAFIAKVRKFKRVEKGETEKTSE